MLWRDVLLEPRRDRRHRWALVTGASRGIGAAFTEALPRHTNLLITARDAEALKRRAARLAAPGREVVWLAADLATEAGRQAVVARAEALGIDLLVNNAGLSRFGPFLDNPPEVERRMVEVNVVAAFALVRGLLPGMIERARAGGPRAGLIMVASTAAFAPVPRLSTYAATKAFALVLAESLTAELRGAPVDILALCPGPTETEGYVGEGRRFGRGDPPERVAREALAALGRSPVHITGLVSQLALGPAAAARAVLAGGLDLALRRIR
ncbi:MAG: SDR family NAD(P)-dependent oxidoreductase [Rhodospirillaceae bacterium]|nr:SDR family NAD(P)-dependent oxidoreductase [Rhodospirillaceae bacterium]